MKKAVLMQKFAKWHIWLGWAAAIPLLLWTVSGLVMVAKPMDEVHGDYLRLENHDMPKPVPVAFGDNARKLTIMGGQIMVQDGRPVLMTATPEGKPVRYALDTPELAIIPPVNEAKARDLAAKNIVGGRDLTSVKLYEDGKAPFDYRGASAVWQLTLKDGSHVYIGRDSGEIEVIRTPYWRLFDFMWGLHIMDPVEREDTHHPVLIISTILALITCIIGTVLLFRRRKAAKR